jgi:endogenous inhibitor of DNA gyrase (YacG/DUF329 family)
MTNTPDPRPFGIVGINANNYATPACPTCGATLRRVANVLACSTGHTFPAPQPAAPARCAQHPAYDADYCPTCGTTTPIGDRA